MQDPNVESTPERSPSPRRRTGRSAAWRERARAGEADWDRRYALIWGIVLLIAFVVPVNYFPRGAPGGGNFLFMWDLFEHVDAAATLSLLMPLFLGAAALFLRAVKARRTRGLWLLFSALLVSIVPIVATGPLMFGPLGGGGLELVAVWLVFLLAPPAVAGANRVLRRTGSDPLGRALVTLGGLALLLALFLPVLPKDKSFMGTILGSDGPWGAFGQAWPIVLWMLVVFGYALLAAAYFLPALNPVKTGPWLSVLGRIALWGFPAAMLILILLSGTGSGRTGSILAGLLFVLGGGIARLYGVMILTAVGLALVLDRRPVPITPDEAREVF